MFIVYSIVIYAQKPDALEVFLQKKNLAHAAVSFKAVDLASGEAVASFNEKMALIPASNMKIITTATALDTLSGSFRYQTALTYDGEIKNDMLVGNLYLKGSGDPTLGSEFMIDDREGFLRDCLIALRKAGIKSIEGDVVVLDQLFGYEGVCPTWLLEDIGTSYAPGVYGISVFDNTYQIYLQSYSAGSRVEIHSVSPQIQGLHFINELKASKIDSDKSHISGLPFSFEKRLHGTIPANRSNFIIKGSIPDPGLFLAEYLYKFLKKNDITIKGNATTYRFTQKLPKNDYPLTTIESPRLAAIVRETNVKSNNHYAEHLCKTLLTFDHFNFSDYWERRGLDGAALLMADGSGLSPTNAVSAGFLTDVLIYMYEKDGATGAFYQSLPVAGKEGTVIAFLKKTPLEGKVRLKSGTIAHVQSYSGYVEKGDKRYAFSLIVNNFSGKRTDLRRAITTLLVDLF
jgi:D-alanyl-D-alanine carboxypeptidase/D-alanyl-D-alanine-endopeptidase (penicillin-binding protein 4)